MAKDQRPLPDLAPCPHCGGEAGYRSFTSRGWLYKITTHYVACTICGCRTTVQETPQEAAEIWNRRVKA